MTTCTLRYLFTASIERCCTTGAHTEVQTAAGPHSAGSVQDAAEAGWDESSKISMFSIFHNVTSTEGVSFCLALFFQIKYEAKRTEERRNLSLKLRHLKALNEKEINCSRPLPQSHLSRKWAQTSSVPRVLVVRSYSSLRYENSLPKMEMPRIWSSKVGHLLNV